MRVRDRQRIAALSVGGAEPALEVGAPDLVRRRRRQERPAHRPSASPPPARLAQPLAAEQVADRARRRPDYRRPLAQQLGSQLLRPPVRMAQPQADDRLGQCIRQTMRRPTRRPRPVGQAAERVDAIASQPLVAGLATNPIPLTERGHRQLAAQPLGNEHHPFVHDAGLFPRHRQVPLPTMMTCHPCRRSKLLPMSPDHTVRLPLTPTLSRRERVARSAGEG